MENRSELIVDTPRTSVSGRAERLALEVIELRAGGARVDIEVHNVGSHRSSGHHPGSIATGRPESTPSMAASGHTAKAAPNSTQSSDDNLLQCESAF
jgi:hypothetical protein